MRIELLRKREDFDDIFVSSITSFWLEKFEWRGTIESETTKTKGTNFLSNSFLNVVYPANIKRKQLSILTSEFLYHPNFFRRMAQTLYTTFAVRKPFELFLSTPSIVIIDPPEDCNNWIFIPGNHSIRVIDVIANRCFVFVKTGFNIEFLKADALARSQNEWLPSPSILEQGNGWYEEQRVVGLPLNRLSSLTQRANILDRANAALAKLYSQSNHSSSVRHYCESIAHQVKELLETSLSKLPSDDLSKIQEFIENMQLLLKNYEDESILVALTHGDFQPGNLLCTEDDFWIIDWEYSAKRSIFYDALVFDLESRFTNDLSIRFFSLLEKLELGDDFYHWTGHSLNWKNKYYLPIFLLEDLLVRLQEVAVEPIYTKSELLAGCLSEFLKIKVPLTQIFSNQHATN